MWQPIETAPKDGSIVVLWRPQPEAPCRGSSRIIAKWNDEANAWIWPEESAVDIEFSDSGWEADGGFWSSSKFTHWMPCTAPTA